ncbi:MAG TPA: hypothetical protein VIK86_09365 [Candidatus Paceibacterota bacterium]
MYKNRRFKVMLVILLMVMVILSLKLSFALDKINGIKNQGSIDITVDKNQMKVEKYGYSDILDVLRKSSYFSVKTINIMDQDKCNIQVDYSGDIKLLYNSLQSLNESKNLLIINSININKNAKTTIISIDFKKNK